MKRLTTILLTLATLIAVLFILAARYEVISLKTALTKMVKNFQGVSAFSLPSPGKFDKASSKPTDNKSESSIQVNYKNVSFSITEESLNHILSEQKVLLNGFLIWQRNVSSRLSDGNISLNTVNTLRVIGTPIVRYPGSSNWTLGMQEERIGIKLNELKVVRIPFPFSQSLFSWVLKGSEDGWIRIRTPSGQIVEKIEMSNGKVLVSGKVR